MPLTWVWGVKAIDSRDLLDPHPKPNGSKLVFEETFDITKPKAQVKKTTPNFDFSKLNEINFRFSF